MSIKDKIKSGKSWLTIGVIVSILTIVGMGVKFVLGVEDRYAKKEDILGIKTEIVIVQADLKMTTDNILKLVKNYAMTRKTVLELKEANGTIVPEEIVELNNLKESLSDID